MSSAVTVLCVCSFNQTRSVMMEALLTQHVAAHDIDARVVSAGTRAGGGRATSETVSMLAARGLDVAAHRGRPLDLSLVGTADLIVTAERDHMIDIASRWPDATQRTFTLPELIHGVHVHGGRLGAPIPDWLEELNRDRPGGIEYLDDTTIGQIVDPTGQDRRTWEATFTQIDDLTRQLAKALS